MQIGFIKQESMSVKDKGTPESKVVKWLECSFRIGGIRPFSAKMTPNKRKEKPNQPDFIIYLRANINKGDTFRDIAIGSLWLGEKVIDGVLKKFMTGTLEVAFTKVSIAVWKAEPRFEGEVVNYLYEIKTMKTLHLTVTKEWFEKILSGHKKEDFREIKPHWKQRLKEPIDLVKIVNGYGEHRPTIIAKFTGLRITDDDELTDLGTGCFFAIGIGKFIEVKND